MEDPDHVAGARASALGFIAGHTVTELQDLGEEIFEEAMADRIWPGTRALAQPAPRRGPAGLAGDRRPIEIAQIIAPARPDQALGTVAEHVDGVYTGQLVGDMLHGPAKARP